jgi:hypothetical protein
MIQLLDVHRLDSPVMLTVFALYVSACLLPCRARPTSAIREFSMQHNVSPARPSTMQCYMHNKNQQYNAFHFHCHAAASFCRGEDGLAAVNLIRLSV